MKAHHREALLWVEVTGGMQGADALSVDVRQQDAVYSIHRGPIDDLIPILIEGVQVDVRVCVQESHGGSEGTSIKHSRNRHLWRVKRVLILRFSSIGDIVLTTPVVRELKAVHGSDMEIHYLTKSSFRELLAHNPHIDTLWTFKDDLDEVLSELQQISFDYVLDLHKNLRSSKVKRSFSQVPSSSFDKLNWAKWLVVNLNIDRLPDKHIVDRYREAARPLDIQEDGKGLDYFFPPDFESKISAYGLEHKGYVAWVVSAAHRGKRWSVEKQASILSSLRMPVVLIGGPEDTEIGQALEKTTSKGLLDLCGRTDLHASADIIRNARLVLSPDTGMMHIAAALGTPIISIWGCTHPKFGMYPYRPAEGSMIIQPEGLRRRPCSKLGNRCQYPGWCIERIDDAEVIQSIETLWTQKGMVRPI